MIVIFALIKACCTSVLQLRIAAYDSAYPDHRAVADVYITAIRNPSGPIFEENPYRVTVTDTHVAGVYQNHLYISAAMQIIYFCR